MSTKPQVVALTVLAVGLGISACKAGDLNLTRSARSGASSFIAYERSWDHNCQNNGIQVSLTGQASHGTVSVEQGTSIIPASTPRSGSTGQCAGRPIAGSQIMYRSEPGFHGRDHVSWQVTYGNGKSGSTDVTIVVK